MSISAPIYNTALEHLGNDSLHEYTDVAILHTDSKTFQSHSCFCGINDHKQFVLYKISLVALTGFTIVIVVVIVALHRISIHNNDDMMTCKINVYYINKYINLICVSSFKSGGGQFICGFILMPLIRDSVWWVYT